MIKRNQHDPRYIIKSNRPVYVYKNLHKDCWSVKQHGLVKAHIPKNHSIGLWDCYFHVDVKGREKVLREKKKNVHQNNNNNNKKKKEKKKRIKIGIKNSRNRQRRLIIKYLVVKITLTS